MPPDMAWEALLDTKLEQYKAIMAKDCYVDFPFVLMRPMNAHDDMKVKILLIAHKFKL